MSQTKLKIFKIKISENSRFDFEKKTLEAINKFLNDENTVYINHSSSILTEDIEEYGVNKTINKYIVITLIYKDIKASQYDLKNTSKKIKNVVKKEVEKGENIPEPKIETNLEKEIKNINEIIK